MGDSQVTIKLTSDEVLVLSHWLEKLQMTDLNQVVDDPAVWAPIHRIAGARGGLRLMSWGCVMGSLEAMIRCRPAASGVSRRVFRGDHVIKRVREVAGTVLVAAVAVSGCGGAESEGAKSSSEPTSTASPGSTASTPSAQVVGGEADPSLDGHWLYPAWDNGGSAVILLVDGQQVELNGKHHCRGKASKEAGLYVIRLKCDDGNTDRTVGRVYGLSRKSMTVDWEGFGADAYFQHKPAASKARTDA
ncbi:hypothetical protein ACFRIC_41120 [Streptomyces sp. NPDC056738]|uniref:hypothetical protein n=1 Tax=Streptomyces sp. NPDC056738 TaxID=3345933 RepID=UPI003688ECDE